MKKKYLYLLLRVLVYLLVLGAVLYGLYESPYNPHPHSAEDIRRWVVGFGVWAPLIYVAVYTIRPLLLFPTRQAFAPAAAKLWRQLGRTPDALPCGQRQL